jgi:hypothetical protein
VFPQVRAAFATEFIADAFITDNSRSLPSACGPFDGSPLAEWIKSYRTVEDLDFDVLVTGHGSALLDKTIVRETREYFEQLRAEVAAGMAAGQTLEQLKASVQLERYEDWARIGICCSIGDRDAQPTRRARFHEVDATNRRAMGTGHGRAEDATDRWRDVPSRRARRAGLDLDSSHPTPDT